MTATPQGKTIMVAILSAIIFSFLEAIFNPTRIPNISSIVGLIANFCVAVTAVAILGLKTTKMQFHITATTLSLYILYLTMDFTSGHFSSYNVFAYPIGIVNWIVPLLVAGLTTIASYKVIWKYT